jgi:hypothetical protein
MRIIIDSTARIGRNEYVAGELRIMQSDQAQADAAVLLANGWAHLEGAVATDPAPAAQVTLDIHSAAAGQKTTEI